MHPAALRLVANRVTPPAVEPIDLVDAKQHLNVETNDDDLYIQSLIVAAREYVENDIHRALITQTWERKLDWFPRDRWEPILLPRPPLSAVESVTYIDDAGDQQTLSPSIYLTDLSSEPGRVWLAPDQQWPTTDFARPNSVTARYEAGYGASGSSVPEPLLHAIKLLVAQLYEYREPETCATVNLVGKSYDWLVGPYRIWWF